MFEYLVYGGRLSSDLEFPDLSPATGADLPSWTVRVVTGPAPSATEVLVGEHAPPNGGARLWRSDVGLRLEYEDFGSYVIRPGGTEIVWYARPDDDPEMARAVILGPALALALQEAGTLCLHGSAVALTDHEAIAVLAPKYHGKSTLACALVADGARLVTDDTIVLNLDAPRMVRPGVHSLRLWDDSAARLEAHRMPGRMVSGVKNTLVGLPPEMLVSEPVTLSAIYVLESVRATEGRPAATRARMKEGAAAFALAVHTKLPDPLVGFAVAGLQLRWVAAVARAVPVYSLQVVRDYDRLSEAVELLRGWHETESGVPSLIAVGGR